MDYRNLEISIISAKDLKNVNLISKMDVYVVVSISGNPKTQQKTNVDRNGNTNPSWNFPMKFTIEEAAARHNRLSVVFTLRCDRSLGDKDIGEVRVPITDLIESIENGKLQFVTYQVRKPSGKPKGELNFSYKWSEKISGAAAAPPTKANLKSEEPVTAYPAPVVGPSSAYTPPSQPYAAPGLYPPQQGYGYQPPPPQRGYGYPPPPPQPGYGYPPPPPPGYGYPPQQGYGYYPPVQQPAAKKNKFGLGLGAGLLGGALGGLLIGDMVSDAAYDNGGFCDGGGFDGGFDGGF